MHVKGFTARHPDVAKHLRGTYAGLVAPAALDYLRDLGVTAVELMPIHHFVGDKHLRDRGLTNYWGYNSIGFFAPDIRYAATRAAGGQVSEFKTMVQGAPRGGHRGHPRRRLQPHRRGQPPGADAVLPRHRQRRLLPAHPDDRRYYMDYTGLRQHAEHDPPAHAAAHHGQPALLDPGDARRRLPLRPGLGAGPRAERRRPARRVLRHHPPGSGHLAGQAHRRAVGPRRRRLSGRQLPGSLGGVERHLPRHRAGLLEGRRGAGGEHGATGSPAPATSTAGAAAARTPASTSSPPTTASRSRTSSATTTSTTRPTARTTATATTTTCPGTAASRGRPTTSRSSRCASGRSATSWPRCCSPRACRC